MVQDRPSGTRAWRIAAAWGLACAVVLLWWTTRYDGWIARAGEWQFARLGSFFPALTLAALVLLLGVPAALAAGLRARRPVADPVERMRAGVRRWRRIFAIAALAGSAVVTVVLLSLATLPGAGGPALVIVGPAVPAAEGLAQLRGRWSPGRIARLDEDYGLMRRRLWVAPVVFAGQAAAPVRLLTTLMPDAEGRPVPVARGVLVRRGVPAELRRLYRAAGVTIAPDALLLLPDRAAVRWRTLALAAQAAVATLIALAGWALLRRQERRIDRLVAAARGRPDH